MPVIPPLLQPGDCVALVATARAVDFSAVEKASHLFQSWGLSVTYNDRLFHTEHQFAGTDYARATQLQSFIDDPNINMICCLRGGYGTARITDKVDFSTLLRQPKWITGFSDVTVLHAHLAKLGVASLHCQMPVLFNQQYPTATESIYQALFHGEVHYSFKAHPLNNKGTTNATLIGGNLSVLHTLISTPDEMSYHDKLLFIEDLDEYLYHIDRMMVHFKRTGKLGRLKGLIVGHMSDMNDNKIPFGKTAYEIIQEHVSEYDFPVVFDFPAGHLPDNRALIFGVPAKLTARAEEVTFSQSVHEVDNDH